MRPEDFRGLYDNSGTVLGKDGKLEDCLRKMIGKDFRIYRPRENPGHCPDIFLKVRAVELNGRILYGYFDDDCYIVPKEGDRLRELA